MLDGAVQGVEAVRTIVATIRAFYGDSQEFHFVGSCGDNGWLEDYIARVDDKSLDSLVATYAERPGQTPHVVASYRPVRTMRRVCCARGSPALLATYFLDGRP